jgi:hypothetical protein
MTVVFGLVLAIALTTLVKLGTRRLFRGPPQPAAKAKVVRSTKASPSRKPKPTARTNAKGRRRR